MLRHRANPIATRSSRHRWRNAGGFTLIEVMVSVALIATAFVSLLTLQRQTVVAQSQIHQLTVASMIAEDRLERMILQAQGYDRLVDYNDELTLQYPDFDIQADVEEVDPNMLPVVMFMPEGLTLRLIRVVVSWEDGAHVRTYELQHFVTQKLI